MNKSFLLIVILVTSLINVAYAQSQSWYSIDGSTEGEEYTIKTIESNAYSHRIEVTIHGFYDYTIEQNGKKYHQLHTKKGYIYGIIGEPQFIAIPQLIAIPEGASYTVSLEEGEWSDFEIGLIAPSQRMCLESEPNPEFYLSEKAYAKLTYSPTLLSIGDEQKWRDIRNIPISICPFKYHPLTNKLSVLSSFILNVTFHDASKKSTVLNCDIEKAYTEHIFDNNILSHAKSNTIKKTMSSDNYDYLIIVGNLPEILNSQKLKDFQKWKAFKGYKTKVVSTNTIGTTTAAIKNYIIQERTKGIEYVLFIGDSDKIPLKVFYTPADRNVNSDYWYGCLDGDNDYEADIPIGRFSTNSLADFENMVNKTIEYEKSFNGYYDETLLVANKENAPGKYQNCCEEIRNSSYSTDFTFNLAYGASSNNGGLDYTNADVVNDINNQMHIVNYRGHGGYNNWWNWNTSNENFTDAEIININSRSIYFNICCWNGDITHEPCFMETFTRSDKGAIACLASTMASYTYPNHEYDKKLFTKLLNDNVWHIGDLNVAAQIATFSMSNNALLAKDNAFVYLCGGDPSLEIWTNTPASFNSINIYRVNNNLIISIPDYSSYYTVSVVSEDGELLGNYQVTSNPCTIAIPDENFYITIHKHNYYPYVVFCSTSSFIQNKTFETNAYYDNSPINIGYDVTTEEPLGNVIIKNKTKLYIRKGTNQVNIKNGFECELGGELLIY